MATTPKATRTPQGHRPADVYEYVAKQPIYHGNVLAYAAGDLVPEANVEAHGYSGEQVERRPTGDTEQDQPARRTKRPADDAPAT